MFGGINLNRAVGGINPAAVDRMARVKGGWGRFVWMPSSDSESHVRFHDEDRPFVSVSKDGRLLPEVKQVVALIARYDLVWQPATPARKKTFCLCGKHANKA